MTTGAPSTSEPRAATKAAEDDQLTSYPNNGSSETDTEKMPIGLAPLAPLAPEADVAPDGGYGWVVVACVFLINAHTWGINSVCAFPPFSGKHPR